VTHGNARVRVTVVWATAAVQEMVALELPAGAVAGDALARSGLVERHRIDQGAMRLGIHGRLVRESTVLADGDRVEICRPLVADPKEARRARAGARRRGEPGGGGR
jgi:uncharacterized protein